MTKNNFFNSVNINNNSSLNKINQYNNFSENNNYAYLATGLNKHKCLGVRTDVENECVYMQKVKHINYQFNPKCL